MVKVIAVLGAAFVLHWFDDTAEPESDFVLLAVSPPNGLSNGEIVGLIGITLHKRAIAVRPGLGISGFRLYTETPARRQSIAAPASRVCFRRGLKQCRHDSAESQQGDETKELDWQGGVS